MARAMLTFSKEVLSKVSFNPDLFTRELNKALQALLPHEVDEIYLYVLELAEYNPALKSSLYLFNYM